MSLASRVIALYTEAVGKIDYLLGDHMSAHMHNPANAFLGLREIDRMYPELSASVLKWEEMNETEMSDLKDLLEEAFVDVAGMLPREDFHGLDEAHFEAFLHIFYPIAKAFVDERSERLG